MKLDSSSKTGFPFLPSFHVSKLTDTLISVLAGTMWSVRAILPFIGEKLRSREEQGLVHGLLLEVLGVLREFHIY